jgi:hypothetical protein
MASAAGVPPGLAKSYNGTARNVTAALSGTITLGAVFVTGGNITGTFAFHAPLAGAGPFQGTITATNVTFTVTPTAASCSSCTKIVFTGEVSPVVSMSGTWVAHLKSGPPQSGTWTVGSTWNGTAHNITVNENGELSLVDVTETATGKISGGVVWTGLTGNGAFAGTIHGSVLNFREPHPSDGYGVFIYAGTVDAALGTMSGTYDVPSDGQHGTFQLRRSGATATAV